MKKHSIKIILLLFVLGVAIIGLQKVGKQKALQSFTFTSTPAQSPTASPSQSSSPPPELHCIDEKELQNISGKTVALRRETMIPEDNAVECEYDSDDLVNNTPPSVYYVFYRNPITSAWDNKLTDLSTKPGYKHLDQDPNIFAYINPVPELAQGSFYGKADHVYIELTYTPVSEDSGAILDKGIKMTQKVLELMK